MDVRPLREDELPAVLPLIAAYQRFYGVAAPDDARNAAFFRRFLAPSDDGLLLGAWRAGELVGHACLYWTFSSVSAREAVLLNDLFVVERHRGAGIGRALIEAAVAVGRERRAGSVAWMTQLDNREAQRLYERTGAARSAWFAYDVALE
jgi:GNAT superfamily N-acetyltransferase